MMTRIRNMSQLERFILARRVLIIATVIHLGVLASPITPLGRAFQDSLDSRFGSGTTETLGLILIPSFMVLIFFSLFTHLGVQIGRNEKIWSEQTEERQQRAKREIAVGLHRWIWKAIDGRMWNFQILNEDGSVELRYPVPHTSELLNPVFKGEELYLPYRLGLTTYLGDPIPLSFTPEDWVAKLKIVSFTPSEYPLKEVDES